jgi:hypothetical protein
VDDAPEKKLIINNIAVKLALDSEQAAGVTFH